MSYNGALYSQKLHEELIWGTEKSTIDFEEYRTQGLPTPPDNDGVLSERWTEG